MDSVKHLPLWFLKQELRLRFRSEVSTHLPVQWMERLGDSLPQYLGRSRGPLIILASCVDSGSGRRSPGVSVVPGVSVFPGSYSSR